MVVTSQSFVTYPAGDSLVDLLKPRRLLLLHADIVDLHLSLHVDFHLLYVNPFQMSTLYGQSKRLTLWLHVDIVDLHYCTLWTPKALQLRRLPLHVDILDHWPCLLCTLYNQSNCEDYRYNLDFFLLTLLTYIYLPRVLCKLSNVKCQLNPNQFNCKDYLYTLTLLTYIYLRCTLSTRCLLSTF